MHIPCPAHRLAHISQSASDDDIFKAQVGTEIDKNDSVKAADESDKDASDEISADIPSEPSDKQVIEPGVSSN